MGGPISIGEVAGWRGGGGDCRDDVAGWRTGLYFGRWSCGDLAALSVLAFVGSGCASVLRGKEQEVKFDTDPPAGDGGGGWEKHHAWLRRVHEARHGRIRSEVVVSKEGYQTVKFELNADWDGLSLLDLHGLLGGV